MKIKIGNTTYDSDKILIMIKPTDDELIFLGNMKANQYSIYAAFPDSITDTKEIERRMEEFKNE